MKSKLTPLDREMLKEFNDALGDTLTVSGVEGAVSWLKQYILVPPWINSQRFLDAISRREPLKELLAKLPPDESHQIREILKKGGKNARGES